MITVDKVTSGVSCATSGAGAGYWALRWLDVATPNQWVAIGVLGSLFAVNFYYTRKEDRRKEEQDRREQD